jgi:hypothetical protein
LRNLHVSKNSVNNVLHKSGFCSIFVLRRERSALSVRSRQSALPAVSATLEAVRALLRPESGIWRRTPLKNLDTRAKGCLSFFLVRLPNKPP